MKKLREAYENDVVAVNVSPRPAPRHPPASGLLLGQPEKYVRGAGGSVCQGKGHNVCEEPPRPHSTFSPSLCVFTSLATSQPDPRTKPQRSGHLLDRAFHAPVLCGGPRRCCGHPLPPICSKCKRIWGAGGSLVGAGWCLGPPSSWVWVGAVAVGAISWGALNEHPNPRLFWEGPSSQVEKTEAERGLSLLACSSLSGTAAS